jgi:hypothetical protein
VGHCDDIKVVEIRSRKQRVVLSLLGWILGLLFIIVAIRAIALIFFPHSWLASIFAIGNNGRRV